MKPCVSAKKIDSEDSQREENKSRNNIELLLCEKYLFTFMFYFNAVMVLQDVLEIMKTILIFTNHEWNKILICTVQLRNPAAPMYRK